jgi:hypothetical protein
VTLTSHRLLVPWSWVNRAILLAPLWAERPVQSLSACTRVHFNFYPFYRLLNEAGMSFNLSFLAHNSLHVTAINIASIHKLTLCFVTAFSFLMITVQLQPFYEEVGYYFCLIFIDSLHVIWPIMYFTISSFSCKILFCFLNLYRISYPET